MESGMQRYKKAAEMAALWGVTLRRVQAMCAQGRIAGAALACYLALNTYAARVIDGSFHYPAHSGGAILLSTLAGVLLFRDKLSRRQIAACTLGLVAIVLMNF